MGKTTNTLRGQRLRALISRACVVSSTVLFVANATYADGLNEGLYESQIQRALQLANAPKLAELDVNKDERLSQAEAQADPLLARQFSRFDRDDNRYISVYEYRQYLAHANEKHNRVFQDKPAAGD